jgi:hypothetical protein
VPTLDSPAGPSPGPAQGLAGLAPAEAVRVTCAVAPVVTVILPVYNESPVLPSVVEQVADFAAAHPRYRFLFVDDGSSDGSGELLEKLIAARPEPDGFARVLRYGVNSGKGFAVWRGVMDAADGASGQPGMVIMIDGDLAYSLDHLFTVERALEHADVVIGCRGRATAQRGPRLVRKVMGWAFNGVARACIGHGYTDTQAGLKGFRLEAARRLFGLVRVSGFSFDVELLYLAHRLGYRIAEVPARVSQSHWAKPSSVRLVRDPARMFCSVVSVAMTGALGRYEQEARGLRPLTLVSFDCEEFDIPAEFGRPIAVAEQMRVGAEGMRRALDLLAQVPARATFFTTASFAREHPDLIRRAAAAGHEIASHGAQHSVFQTADLESSRRDLEAIAQGPIAGFRRPRFEATPAADILAAGYSYDASVNPVWLPGRYNGWHLPRRAFRDSGLLRIPVSATPLVRWPLFWLSFKNEPEWVARMATRAVLAADGYAALCFHPWELCDLRGSGLPWYIRRLHGRRFSERLLRHLRWLALRSTFATYSELASRAHAGQWPVDRLVE